jgi:twinkle protein
MAHEIAPRQQCPACAANGLDSAKDNLASYADGKYCQACAYVDKPIPKTDLIPGTVMELKERGLTFDICQKYNVRTAEFTGQIGQHKVVNEIIKILPYYQNGKLLRQKIKSKRDKSIMSQKGDTKTTQLFGQHIFSPTLKLPIVITEGEEDAMAMHQMTGLPAVSIINGAQSAAKDLTLNLEWLNGFREVLLCFDSDEPGRKAFDDCVGLFDPGFCKKVNLPLKDANEMLLASRGEEVKKATWNAEVIRPNTIVFPRDLREKVLTKPKYGAPWPWAGMTKATYGMRLSEVYLLAAATSIGKTEFIREIISFLLENGTKIGLFSFEQQPEQTLQRFIGASLNKRVHLPGGDWDEVAIAKGLDDLADNIALYQPQSGRISIESILINIRFLNKAYGMTFFVIDNLKALSTNPVIDGKRVPVHEYASHAMSQFVMVARQLNINIFVVNHLASDKISLQAYVSTSPKNVESYLNRTSEEAQKYINRPGLTWETGREPGIENIFGGGAIKDLADAIIVLSRNRMSQDEEEHRTIKVTFLKNRIDSNFEGYNFKIKYSYATGRLTEDFTQKCENREDTNVNLYTDLI